MKRMIYLISMVIGICFLFATKGISQTDDAGKKAIANLSKLEGTWHGDMTFKADGKESKMDYKVKCWPIPGGAGYYMDEYSSSPVVGDSKGGNLVGYDPYSKKIYWYSVDNTGTCHSHVAKWIDDNHLNMYHSSMRDGKKYEEKLDIMIKGKDQLSMHFKQLQDGKVQGEITGMMNLVAEDK